MPDRFRVIAIAPARDEQARIGLVVSRIMHGAARDAVDIADVSIERGKRTAIMLGAEGPGLTAEAMRATSIRVRIPMARGADSLNVATAAAIAMHALLNKTPA